MSPGHEYDHNCMLLTQTSQTDYEELCRLDILGLADSHQHDQKAVYDEFKEQLVRDEEGWYETGLPWRGGHPVLPSNKQGSIRRLSSLNKKLERQGLTNEYDLTIRDQKEQGIIEDCPTEPIGRGFYIPHKPVVRKEAASTKLRVVYDVSARANPNAPSFNECLYPGPALPIYTCLIWVHVLILPSKGGGGGGGVIEQHLQTWKSKMPEAVAALRNSLYVGDLLNGGHSSPRPSPRAEEFSHRNLQ